MSDDRRPLSEKTRQELLDEIYLLRDVAGERGQQVQERDQLIGKRDDALASLQRQLELILRSRSWRLTAPLRWVSHYMNRATGVGVEAAAAGPSPGAKVQRPESPCDSDPTSSRLTAPIPAEDRSDGKPRLYVDITELASREGRTGVQRVTREILRALLDAPPTAHQVQAVYAPPGQFYRLAKSFTSKLLGESGQVSPDPSMAARSGDVFLGLDHSMRTTVERAADLANLHERGVRVWFVCNDVLPLSHPEWFPSEVHVAFKAWLETIAHVADGVACISLATQSELRQQLDRMNVPRNKPLALAHFHLGAGPAVDGENAAMVPPEQASLIERLRGLDAFLMVGTLEPRKGHAQALQAFESLWAAGSEVVLVIAGFPGWMTDVLARRIRHHDEFGKRLFWFMGPDDAVLERLYSTCTVLLAPSEGEGFGLPLVEAAHYGLPILCRDLPVFHEVAGDHATYFSGLDADSLAIAIQNWLGVYGRGAVVSSEDIRALTWGQSAQKLADIVLHARVGVAVANT